MMSFLAGPDGTTKKRGFDADDCVEVATKNLLLTYSYGTTLEMMLEEAGIRNADEDTVEILYDIGIDVMIDIDCTRGWLFGAEKFKDAMEKMQMKPLVARKLYRTLEKWRVLSKPVPQPTDTPFSSSSSSVSASLSFS